MIEIVIALEGDWSSYKDKGFINHLDGATVVFTGAFKVKLQSTYSGGVIALASNGYITILQVVGHITDFMTDESGNVLSSELFGYMKA